MSLLRFGVVMKRASQHFAGNVGVSNTGPSWQSGICAYRDPWVCLIDGEGGDPPGSPPAPQTPPVPPAAPAPRVYTEAEVQEKVNAAAAAARRAAEKKADPPAPAPRSEPAQPSAPAADGDFQRYAKLQRALGNYEPTAEQEAIVDALWTIDRPGLTDVVAWVNAKAQAMGIKSKSATPPASAAAPAAAPNPPPVVSTPNVPPPISVSAPGTAVPLERDVDVLSLDASSIHELMRKKGASDPSRPYDPKNRAGRREIRRQVDEALSKRRVRLGSL